MHLEQRTYNGSTARAKLVILKKKTNPPPKPLIDTRKPAARTAKIIGVILRKWMYVAEYQARMFRKRIYEIFKASRWARALSGQETKENNSAFSFGVHSNNYDKIYYLDFWPESVSTLMCDLF